MKKNVLLRTVSVAAAALAVCALSSCGGNKAASGEKVGGSTIKLTGKEGVEGWTPFNDRVTITVPVYDRGKAGYPAVDNNYWTQWVQKSFGDKWNVEVKYVAIPRSDVMTKYSMLIAAKDTPTILMEYDYPKVTQWANDGAMQVFSMDAFKHVAPNYYARMVEDNQLVYTQMGGKTYFALARRPYYNTAYTYASFVRMDWLRKVGYDHVPKTYQEYTDAMDKIIAAKLTDKQPIGMSLASSASAAYVPNFTYRDFPCNEEEWAEYSSLGTPSFTWAPTYKLIKRTNAEYHKGYTTKEFELDVDGSQKKTDFINGKTYSFGDYLSENMDWLKSFYEKNPGAELALADINSAYDGIDVKTIQDRANNPFGMIIGFSSLATDDQLKAAWMYMEWMNQADTLKTMQYGIEGTNYTIGADGYPKMIDLLGSGKPEMLNSGDNKDMWCGAVEAKTRNTIEDSIASITPKNIPQDFTKMIVDQYYELKKIADAGCAYTDPVFAVAIASESEYNASLLSLYQEYYTKLVKCDPAQFDTMYNDFKQKYLDAGYQKILEERLAAYKAGQTTKLPDISKQK